ncbi:MAG: hypothetical protein HY579_10135 [Nitrospinae bacterium]|nr:hypothetical protein [Nitrospinota bacterium]
MVIGISHEDLKKLKDERNVKKVGNRKSRTAVLSDKTKTQVLKKFEEATPARAKEEDILIDEHLKMNDNYMRTGKYIPKSK